MKSPLTSNLCILIRRAIDDCYFNGVGKAVKDNITVYADWIESKRIGYSVIQISILVNGVGVFSYDDYGTECISD